MRSSRGEDASYILLGLAAAVSVALFFHSIAQFVPQAQRAYARLGECPPTNAQLAGAAAPQPTNLVVQSRASHGGPALTNRGESRPARPATVGELPAIPNSKARTRSSGTVPAIDSHQNGARRRVAPLWPPLLSR